MLSCILHVSLSFLILRKKAPDMKRPYKVKHYKIAGALAVLTSGFMVVMYIVPNSGSALVWQEWAMAGGWSLLGVVFFIICKRKYKEKFASHVDVLIDDEIVDEEENREEEVKAAIELVMAEEDETKFVQPIAFNYNLPVNIAFGTGEVAQTGELTSHMVRKHLLSQAAAVQRSQACMTR